MTREIERASDLFWEALADGEFRVPLCSVCREAFFPPAPLCPHCGGRDIEWTAADEGRLYSFTRQHRTAPGFDSPVVMGIVELDIGPRLLAPIAAEYDRLTIGQSVRIEPRPYEQEYSRGERASKPFFAATVQEGE